MRKIERRRVPRLLIGHCVPIELAFAETSQSISATLTDLSVLGFGVEVDSLAYSGQVQVSLNLTLPDGKSLGQLISNGAIAHSYRNQDAFRCGVEGM